MWVLSVFSLLFYSDKVIRYSLVRMRPSCGGNSNAETGCQVPHCLSREFFGYVITFLQRWVTRSRSRSGGCNAKYQILLRRGDQAFRASCWNHRKATRVTVDTCRLRCTPHTHASLGLFGGMKTSAMLRSYLTESLYAEGVSGMVNIGIAVHIKAPAAMFRYWIMKKYRLNAPYLAQGEWTRSSSELTARKAYDPDLCCI